MIRPWYDLLGLRTRAQGAWVFYDWANSAFVTTVVTAVFPVYFLESLARDLPPTLALQRFALATAVALAVSALLAPILGTLSDRIGGKKRLLAGFLVLGVLATAALGGIGPGGWKAGLALFVVANIAASGSFVFYDALLPHVARPGEMDRVSTTGYALGYLGGGLLLAAQILLILRPGIVGLSDAGAASRLAFASVAVWWLVFSLPLLRFVPEPGRSSPAGKESPGRALGSSFRQLAATFRNLRGNRDAFLFLLAFLVYNDGIGTIIRMAAAYGKETGIGRGALIGAILMVQFLGIPFALAFGRIAGRIGTKPALFLCLAVYAGICGFAFFMRTALHFFILAGAVATVQGGCQALSRSLFARLIPADRSGEFFGLFAVSERFAAIAGPGFFALATALTGSSRLAILGVILFFVAGGVLLSFVRVPGEGDGDRRTGASA